MSWIGHDGFDVGWRVIVGALCAAVMIWRVVRCMVWQLAKHLAWVLDGHRFDV